MEEGGSVVAAKTVEGWSDEGAKKTRKGRGQEIGLWNTQYTPSEALSIPFWTRSRTNGYFYWHIWSFTLFSQKFIRNWNLAVYNDYEKSPLRKHLPWITYNWEWNIEARNRKNLDLRIQWNTNRTIWVIIRFYDITVLLHILLYNILLYATILLCTM